MSLNPTHMSTNKYCLTSHRALWRDGAKNAHKKANDSSRLYEKTNYVVKHDAALI